MRSVGLLMTFAFLNCNPAPAQDHEWVLLAQGEIAEGRGPADMFVDLASIDCNGDECQALQRVVFSEPQQIPDTPLFDEMVTLQALNCRTGTLGTMTFTAYRGGEQVDEQSGHGEARQVRPGPFGTAFVNAVCSAR